MSAQTADDDEEAVPRQYASPACLMHEVDPAYFGLAPAEPSPAWPAVAQWRKAERVRLIDSRRQLSAATRAAHAGQIARHLDALLGAPAGRTVSAYWPFRGEPDLRAWLAEFRAGGGQTALPIVVAKKTPLVFRLWQEGDRLERGVWNIPEPVDGAEVRPDIVIAPVVGFDPGCYRLGYGGGFFDRTLAALPAGTLAVGVGYAQAALATIHPQPFDVPMRHIVTEGGVRTR